LHTGWPLVECVHAEAVAGMKRALTARLCGHVLCRGGGSGPQILALSYSRRTSRSVGTKPANAYGYDPTAADFRDFLKLLNSHRVEYLLVGLATAISAAAVLNAEPTLENDAAFLRSLSDGSTVLPSRLSRRTKSKFPEAAEIQPLLARSFLVAQRCAIAGVLLLLISRPAADAPWCRAMESARLLLRERRRARDGFGRLPQLFGSCR